MHDFAPHDVFWKRHTLQPASGMLQEPSESSRNHRRHRSLAQITVSVISLLPDWA